MAVAVKQLNADTTFLLTFFSPLYDGLHASSSPTNGHASPSIGAASRPADFTVLVDPWLDGESRIWHPRFACTRHTIPSAIASLADLPTAPDVVLISQDQPDHCHQATLRQLDPQLPHTLILAHPAAAKRIRSWRFFPPSKVRSFRPFAARNKDKTVVRFRIPSPTDPGALPGEATLAFIPAKRDITGVHNAIAITYRPPEARAPITSAVVEPFTGISEAANYRLIGTAESSPHQSTDTGKWNLRPPNSAGQWTGHQSENAADSFLSPTQNSTASSAAIAGLFPTTSTTFSAGRLSSRNISAGLELQDMPPTPPETPEMSRLTPTLTNTTASIDGATPAVLNGDLHSLANKQSSMATIDAASEGGGIALTHDGSELSGWNQILGSTPWSLPIGSSHSTPNLVTGLSEPMASAPIPASTSNRPSEEHSHAISAGDRDSEGIIAVGGPISTVLPIRPATATSSEPILGLRRAPAPSSGPISPLTPSHSRTPSGAHNFSRPFAAAPNTHRRAASASQPVFRPGSRESPYMSSYIRDSPFTTTFGRDHRSYTASSQPALEINSQSEIPPRPPPSLPPPLSPSSVCLAPATTRPSTASTPQTLSLLYSPHGLTTRALLPYAESMLGIVPAKRMKHQNRSRVSLVSSPSTSSFGTAVPHPIFHSPSPTEPKSPVSEPKSPISDASAGLAQHGSIGSDIGVSDSRPDLSSRGFQSDTGIANAINGVSEPATHEYIAAAADDEASTARLTVLLHAFDRVRNAWYLGGTISAGMPGGLQLARLLRPRCWISAHDEDKNATGWGVAQVRTRCYTAAEVRYALDGVNLDELSKAPSKSMETPTSVAVPTLSTEAPAPSAVAAPKSPRKGKLRGRSKSSVSLRWRASRDASVRNGADKANGKLNGFEPAAGRDGASLDAKANGFHGEANRVVKSPGQAHDRALATDVRNLAVGEEMVIVA